MVDRTIFILATANITVSDGVQLSGGTQGEGTHLLGRTITLNNNNWEAVNISDTTADTGTGNPGLRTGLFFSDNDTGQQLNGEQTIGGVTYANNLIVENEFALTVRDPDGNLYRVLAFNIREPGSSPSNFSTIEGLAFVASTETGFAQGFPPIGVPLTVVQNFEFPSDRYASIIAPPCFTAGTQVLTPEGYRLIDGLVVGDMVTTLDHGAQPIRWIGVARLPRAVLAGSVQFRPVTIRKAAFGPGCPLADVTVSPQHRVLVTGWQAELLFGEPDVLVPAAKLVNDSNVVSAGAQQDVVYIHLMFDRHEIIWANGLASESYLPGLAAISDAPGTETEFDALFPQARRDVGRQTTARPCISDKRTQALRDYLTR